MKKFLGFAFLTLFAVCLAVTAFADESVVYLDGTGKTAGAETTIQAAVDALPAEGGHIIVCGDTATTNTAITVGGKTGKVKVTAINGAKFTIARTLKFSSEFEFDDIELVSTSGSMAFIYAMGNKLTFGENVTTSKTDSAIWFALFGGTNTGTVDYDSHLVVRAGTFRVIYGGNYQGTFNGDATLELSNVTVTGTLSGKNNSGTFNGTSRVTLDLRGNKTVSAGTWKEDPTEILVDDGFEAVLTDGTYSQCRIADPSVRKVYVADGANGDGLRAETPVGSLADAYDALSADGGEIVLVGDTTLANAVAFAEKNGDVVLSSENGAKLILAGSIALAQNTNGKAVVFDLPISAENGIVYGGFRNVTFTENCTVTGTLDYYGGTLSSSEDSADNRTVITELPYTVTVNGGTFRKFSGGNCRAINTDMLGSVAAPLTVRITGGSFTDSFDLSGGAFLADDVTLNISGGSFACPIYVRSADVSTQAKATRLSPVVTSDRKYYAMDGDVEINITGGSFTGGIISAYHTNVAYTQLLRGNFTVTVTGGTFADGTVIDATQVKAYADDNKKAALTYAEGYVFDVVRFDTVNGEAKTYDEPLRVAFVGDSITEGVASGDPLTKSYPANFADIAKKNGREVVVANYGVSASGVLETTSVFYFERIAYYLLIEETDADYIVVGLGTNDHLASSRGGLRAKYIENYTELIETLAALPETDKIFMTGAIISGTKTIPAASQLRIRSVIAPLQRQIAAGFAKTDADKFIFVDLFGLTLPAAAAGDLLSGDRLHPKASGYAAMGEAIYGAMFNGMTEPSPDYHKKDIYLSEAGKEFGSGTKDDPTSRVDIAFAMAAAGEDVTVHVIGSVTYKQSIVTPLNVKTLTIVGEGSGASLEMIEDGETVWINSDIRFDNIALKGVAAESIIIGNYHDVVFTDTASLGGVWSFYAGICSYDDVGAVVPYDTVATTSSADDCTVALNGIGTLKNFALGNYRVAKVAPIGTYSGNLTATVGNGYSVSGTNVGAVGQNYLTGAVTVSLPHGFACADYAPIGTVAEPIVYDASKNTGVVTVTHREALTNLDAVFVSGSGSGDGTSVATPTADIEAAYALLGEDGGTVVFVGEYVTSATVNFPAHTARVKLTSVWNGVDYRTSGAAIRFAGTGFIKLNGPTEIDGLAAKLDKGSAGLCANFHPVTIGYDFAVVNTDGSTAYRMYFVGGQNGEAKDGALAAGATNEIKIFSGKFIMVSAFSRSIALEHSGTVTVTIGGTADVKDLYFGALSTGAKGGTGIVYLEENAKITNAYLSGNTVGMTGSAVLHMEDNASVGAFKNSAKTYFANGTRALYYTSTVSIPSDYASHFDTVVRTDYVAEAPRTVYVDGTGNTEDAYATLQDAVAALHDEGGSVIVSGDTTVSGLVEFAKKSGKVTISATDGAKLTIARTCKFASEVEFDNIELVSTSGTYGYIYAQGNKLTIGKNVTTSKTEGANWLSLFGGTNTGTVEHNAHIVVKSGTYQAIYGGNYQGTFGGTSTVEITNATVTGTLSAESYSGTFNGTSTLIVDLRGNKTVSAGTWKEDPTEILVDDGYEAVLTDGMYSQREIVEEPDAEPRTVYVDGTGKTEGAYTSLSAALAEMPGGGTVILSGDVEITENVTLPKTRAVTITSVYGDEDYRKTATIRVAAEITLGGDTTFKDVVIERTKLTSGQLHIIAAGNALTVDTGVVCLNYTGMQWLSLVGGNKSSAYNGETHITVKSGHFRNVFGGNYTGTFTGNTYVEITGGVFDNAVCGGSYNGNFNGDSHLTFGGEAAIVYAASAPSGLIGGNLGAGSTAYTFDGDVYLKVCGNSAITSNVIGGSRASNMTNEGNVYIEFADNAFVYYSTYAGGYAAKLVGNTETVFNGGDMQGNMFGGCYSGTLTGNSRIVVNSGKVCYFKTNLESGWSEPAGEKNIYGGGETGAVNGNTCVEINGGRIFGNVFGGGLEASATVDGTSTVLATNGVIFGRIASADSSVIDLSKGGELSIGVSTDVNSVIGGGKLLLAACVTLSADALSGVTELSINGLPLPQKYVVARSKAEGAAIRYTAQEGEALVENDGSYAIDFEGAYSTVTLTVNYADGCVCRLRPGKLSSGDYLTPVSSNATSSTYKVEPGLYTAKVSYNGSHYYLRYIYIYGRSEAQEVSCVFPAASGIGYEGLIAGRHIDEINEKYYNDNDINDFCIPDSPYFNNRPGSTVFTTNEEANAFIDAKAAECDYMYVFYPAKTTKRDFDFPVVVFTKDEIKEGATLEEIAAVVGTQQGRDVIMITGGVHGNEASGAEGTLAFISELCGEYGSTVFDGTNVGAVVILPRMNPEGLYDYTRATPVEGINTNLNRDYMTLSNVGTQTYAYVYNLFLPTMTLDCHESHIQPVFSDGEIMTDNYDVGLTYFTSASSPHGDADAILSGDLGAANAYVGQVICDNAVDSLRAEYNLRSYYFHPSAAPGTAANYSRNLGAYGYIIEIPGIWGAEEHFARRVFSQVAALKMLIAETLEADGRHAAVVAAAREKIALSAQIFDARRPIVVEQTESKVPTYGLDWNNPIVAADGTVRVSDNRVWQNPTNVAVKYRALPTAYVVSADAAGINAVLARLDLHGIAYKKLDAGTVMTLQQYSGTTSTATLSEAKAVTFANGAYIVPVDGYKAYVTAYLFEPDNTDVTEGKCTFAQVGDLAVDELYRSTESFIGAKMGVDGTYIALPTEGKTVASAVVDGVVYGDVYTEEERAYVVKAKDAVTLHFTDGTSETYYYSDIPGDMDGDRTVDIRDILLAVRALLCDADLPEADVNGDGRLTLLDIVRLMKMCV